MICIATSGTAPGADTDLQVKGELIAFSMRAAERVIRTSTDAAELELAKLLGGINRLKGAVYDHDARDVILVGRSDPARPRLTLDDAVIAIRSRLLHTDWPSVSIDPTPGWRRTGTLKVRYSGGIGGSQFGEDLYQADYLLKRMGHGLEQLPDGVEPYWKLLAKNYVNVDRVRGRFWLYPVLPLVAIRENVVAIGDLKISAFTEVLEAVHENREVEDMSGVLDPAATAFVTGVTENYELIEKNLPVFSRVRSLAESVAVADALRALDVENVLDYWLRDYPTGAVSPTLTVESLEMFFWPEGMETDEPVLLSGGVQLLAAAVRIREGDVTALRDAVLDLRPSPHSLTWQFVVGDWLIPTTKGALAESDFGQLLAHAAYLQKRGECDAPLSLYDRLLESRPEWDSPHVNRGLLYATCRSDYDSAIAEYDAALKLNPSSTMALVNRAAARVELGQLRLAQADLELALAVNPSSLEALVNQGGVYQRMGKLQDAERSFASALQVAPSDPRVLVGHATVLRGLEKADEAFADVNAALAIRPDFPPALAVRAALYSDTSKWSDALADTTAALRADPDFSDALLYHCMALYHLRRHDEAYDHAERLISLEPDWTTGYVIRGVAAVLLGKPPSMIDFEKWAEAKTGSVDAAPEFLRFVELAAREGVTIEIELGD